MMKKSRRAQTILEFTVLLVIVIGVFVAMSQYMKRGLQGRWKTVIDDFGEQYDPRLTNSDIIYNIASNSMTSIQTIKDVGGYWTRRLDNTASVTKVQGSTAVGSQ